MSTNLTEQRKTVKGTSYSLSQHVGLSTPVGVNGLALQISVDNGTNESTVQELPGMGHCVLSPDDVRQLILELQTWLLFRDDDSLSGQDAYQQLLGADKCDKCGTTENLSQNSDGFLCPMCAEC